jgi:hypothetical protein
LTLAQELGMRKPGKICNDGKILKIVIDEKGALHFFLLFQLIIDYPMLVKIPMVKAKKFKL